jgi:hypothetical protein
MNLLLFTKLKREICGENPFALTESGLETILKLLDTAGTRGKMLPWLPCTPAGGTEDHRPGTHC